MVHTILKITQLRLHNTALDKMDIYVDESGLADIKEDSSMVFRFNMPVDVMQKIRNAPGVISVTIKNDSVGKYDEHIFPHNPRYPWNNDNFGPLTLPKKGCHYKS